MIIFRMNLNLTPFQEPRGVMRIFQLIFGICAFSTTLSFTATLTTDCQINPAPTKFEFEYPFRFYENVCIAKGNLTNFAVTADVSSDAQFFVATGVLSMLYAGFIIFVYAYLDELYKSKMEIPMADFMLTTIMAVLWLSASAAWANGKSVLSSVLDYEYVTAKCNHCLVTNGGFNGLNSSIVSFFCKI